MAIFAKFLENVIGKSIPHLNFAVNVELWTPDSWSDVELDKSLHG